MSPIYSGEVEAAPEGQDISSLGHASWSQMLGSEVRKSFGDSPVSKLTGMAELSAAKGVPVEFGGLEGSALAAGPSDEYSKFFENQPSIGVDEAKARVKAAHLDSVLHLPDTPTMKSGALDIMLARARADQERSAKIAQGPTGFMSGALDIGTSLLVSAVDPLNLTVGMIPIMGEARYAKLLASAGDSLIGRTGVRAGVGAAQGTMFSTAMTPVDWLANTQEGRDYGMSQALHSILYGAGTFGLMHVAGGAGSDFYRSVRGRPLYPFAPGEPMEKPGSRAAGPDALASSSFPAELAANLPPRAMEDLTRTSLAQMMRGEPVKAFDVLQAAARIDPHIAEAFEPERIRAATIEHEGRTYEGSNHAEALQKLETERGVRPDDTSDQALNAGFSTTKGRIVNRDAALEIADRAGQVQDHSRPAYGLIAENTTMARPAGEGASIPNLGGKERPKMHEAMPAASAEATRVPAKPAAHENVSIPSDRERGLAADPAAVASEWQRLAASQGPEFRPDVVDAATAAERLPDPVALNPSKRVAEAQRLAAEAEETFRQRAEYMPPEEVEAFNRVLEQMDRDHEARMETIRRGAACLAAAGM